MSRLGPRGANRGVPRNPGKDFLPHEMPTYGAFFLVEQKILFRNIDDEAFLSASTKKNREKKTRQRTRTIFLRKEDIHSTGVKRSMVVGIVKGG